MQTDELRAAVLKAYEVFPALQLTPPIGVCRCKVCVCEEDERALAQGPRETLPSRLIREFTNSAHSRDDGLLRHFLPRMFDLTAEGEEIHAYDETWGFRGLGPGEPRVPQSDYRRNWPREQVQAVDDFFLALFRCWLGAPYVANGDIGERTLRQTLETVAFCGGDVAPLLADWDADFSRAATVRLAGFVVDVAHEYWNNGPAGPGRALGRHWAGAREKERLTLDFLRAPRQRERFDRAMNDEADPTAFWLLAEARGAFGD